jgi:hypothetical protein
MKKVVWMLIFLILLIQVLADGSGTELDPYQITNLTELQNVNNDLSAYYILMNDIDASATSTWNWNGSDYQGFQPIGNSSSYFTGNFDGQNYTISNFYIYRPNSNYVGLFGYAVGSTIANLRLTNVEITGNELVGGIIGSSMDSGVTNLQAEGEINGESNVGGIFGYMVRGVISKSSSSVNLNSLYYSGGLVGDKIGGTVSECYTNSNITGLYYVGGLIGLGHSQSFTITNSYSLGMVAGDMYVGGIVGSLGSDSLVDSSYSTSFIDSSSTTYAGGLVGDNDGSVINSFYDNQTSGRSDTGKGVPKSTADMQNVATFTDTSTEGLTTAWDFVNNPNDDSANNDYWRIDDSYPTLSYFYVGEDEEESTAVPEFSDYAILLILMTTIMGFYYKKK